MEKYNDNISAIQDALATVMEILTSFFSALERLTAGLGKTWNWTLDEYKNNQKP